jgi:hypothetical protein
MTSAINIPYGMPYLSMVSQGIQSFPSASGSGFSAAQGMRERRTLGCKSTLSLDKIVIFNKIAVSELECEKA